jgi:adenylate cyclase
MIDIWENIVPVQDFKDAIVLVGYTTELEQDRHIAPYLGERKFPGVEIQATIIDNLLARDWMLELPPWLRVLVSFIAGLIAVLALNLRRPVLSVSVLLGAIVVYSLVSYYLFVHVNYIVPMATPLIFAFMVGGAALIERMVFAEQDKRQLRQRFAGMMSPERLQAVMDNWDAMREEDRPPKEAAIIFSDVRGFTQTTEILVREDRNPEMVRFLNAYLNVMSQAVFLEGGVVYRMIGDGLMIMFGMPERLENSALRAARAAVRMAMATEDLQRIWPLRGKAPMRMGIGVHTGLLVDAIVGSGRRLDYVIIGDAANTAARIEGYCKVAMEIPRPPGGQVPETVTILISDDVYQKAGHHILVDENIPPYSARGKSEPLRVVRLLGLREGELL